MSCFADGIKDVTDFLSGVFMDEEISQKAKGPNPDTPIKDEPTPIHNPDNDLGTGNNDTLPCEKKLIDAYFAQKSIIKVPVTSGEKTSSVVYRVKRGDTLSKIASKYKGVSYVDIAKKNDIPSPYRLTVGQRLAIPNQIATKDKTVYKKITKATLGAKVFLVVKTKGYKSGETLSIGLHEKKSMLVKADAPLPFLKGTTQQTEVMAHVTFDPDNGSAQAVVEIALRPKAEKKADDTIHAGSLEAWKEKFKKKKEDKKEKKDYLWLKVTSLVGKGEEKEFLRGGELEVGSCNNDKNLGTLSSYYETGGRGSITVSGGTGDWGGVSYGAYQLTSKPHGGNVTKFINSTSFPWTAEFKGLNAGSVAFSKKWKELVTLHGSEFVKIEHEFIKKTHYDILCNKIKQDNGIEVRCHSHTLNDVIWSTAVQMGPKTNVIKKAIANVDILYAQNKKYDKALIVEIYKERGRKKSNGTLVYFSKNSLKVQHGVSNRFISELKKALKRLEHENY